MKLLCMPLLLLLQNSPVTQLAISKFLVLHLSLENAICPAFSKNLCSHFRSFSIVITLHKPGTLSQYKKHLTFLYPLYINLPRKSILSFISPLLYLSPPPPTTQPDQTNSSALLYSVPPSTTKTHPPRSPTSSFYRQHKLCPTSLQTKSKQSWILYRQITSMTGVIWLCLPCCMILPHGFRNCVTYRYGMSASKNHIR